MVMSNVPYKWVIWLIPLKNFNVARVWFAWRHSTTLWWVTQTIHTMGFKWDIIWNVCRPYIKEDGIFTWYFLKYEQLPTDNWQNREVADVSFTCFLMKLDLCLLIDSLENVETLFMFNRETKPLVNKLIVLVWLSSPSVGFLFKQC